MSLGRQHITLPLRTAGIKVCRQMLVCLSDPYQSTCLEHCLEQAWEETDRSKHCSACLNSAEIWAVDSRLQSKRMACVHSTKRCRWFPDVSVRLEFQSCICDTNFYKMFIKNILKQIRGGYYQLIRGWTYLHVFSPCLKSQIGLHMTEARKLSLALSTLEQKDFYQGLSFCSSESLPPPSSSPTDWQSRQFHIMALVCSLEKEAFLRPF